MTRFIDSHREEFGVEPICTLLRVAPSTSDAHKDPAAVSPCAARRPAQGRDPPGLGRQLSGLRRR
jgi:hypothetical protein